MKYRTIADYGSYTVEQPLNYEEWKSRQCYIKNKKRKQERKENIHAFLGALAMSLSFVFLLIAGFLIP